MKSKNPTITAGLFLSLLCLNFKDMPNILPVVGIYKITSPSGKVYIGQSWNITKRWHEHRAEKRHRSAICCSLVKHGPDCHDFEILHTLPDDIEQIVLDRYEQLYMDLYRNCNIKLLNIREAGSIGKLSEETKLKIKEKRKFQITSQETRLKMSLARKGKPQLIKNGRIPWNKGLKGTMTPWNKGIIGIRKASEETKRKQSLALKGKPCLKNRGKIMPSHVRAAIAKANIGRKMSEEQRQKISAANMGRPYHGKNNGKVRSPEVRKLHSEIQKARTDNKGESHSLARLTNEIVLQIRAKFKPYVYSVGMLCKEYGLSRTHVKDIIKRKAWRHI